MYLFYLVLLLNLFSSSAIASAGAGPYQVVLFWYLYRLQLAYSDTITIAAGRCGEIARPCTFDEFAKYISDRPYYGTIGVQSLEPAVDEAAALVAEAWDDGYSLVQDPKTLFGVSGGSGGLKQIVDQLSARIQDVRQAMKRPGSDETQDERFQKLLEATDSVTAARRYEYNIYYITSFQQWCEEQGHDIPVIVKTVRTPNSGSNPGNLVWQELDVDQMISEAQAQGRTDVVEIVRAFVDGYADDKIRINNKYGAARGHTNAIKLFQVLQSTLRSPLPCNT